MKYSPKSKKKLRQWKEYIENLFKHSRPDSLLHSEELDKKAFEITKDKVKHAIKLLNNKRAVGPDNVNADS